MKKYRLSFILENLNLLNEGDRKMLQNDIESNEKLLKEVQAVYPSDMFLSFDSYDGKESYHHLEVCLIDGNGNPETTVKYYQKRYSFFNPEFHKIKNITQNDKNCVIDSLTKPKYIGIGKLTFKKVEDWRMYLLLEIEELKKISVKNTKVGEDYRAKIAPYNPIYWSGNPNRGEVTINKVTLDFEICESFVSEKIRINCGSNFEDFLKLSDNGFKAS